MPTEIERKFLVCGDAWRAGARGKRYIQGYLATGKSCTVRIRLAGEQAWLTVKGPRSGLSRVECEYEVPPEHAREMLALCGGRVIEKTRYVIEHCGMKWEVDEFEGPNKGLIVAEVELPDEAHEVERPDWVGKEVTGEPRYLNARLVQSPYSNWTEAERADAYGR